MGWLSDLRGSPGPAPRPNPSLRAVYDGRRRGREMVQIYPGSDWGGRAYGLGPDDDFRFDPTPERKGAVVTLHVGVETMARLIRQRDLRAMHRRRRR